LTSLFAVAWPSQSRPPALHPTAVTGVPQSSTPAGTPGGPSIVDVPLTDPAGVPARLREELPAVVVLIGDCRCDSLLAAAVAAADPAVTVVAVTPTLPPGTAVPTGPRIRLLVDRGAGLDRAVPATARRPGRAAVLLLGADGALIATAPAAASVDDFRADLARLHA